MPKSRPANDGCCERKEDVRGLERDAVDARRAGREQTHEDTETEERGSEADDAGT